MKATKEQIQMLNNYIQNENFKQLNLPASFTTSDVEHKQGNIHSHKGEKPNPKRFYGGLVTYCAYIG